MVITQQRISDRLNSVTPRGVNDGDLFSLSSLSMKYCDVTTEIKLLQQYYHMVLFGLHVSGNEIFWCDHSHEFPSIVLSNGTICFVLSSKF